MGEKWDGGHSSNQVPEFCSRDCDTASVAGFLHIKKAYLLSIATTIHTTSRHIVKAFENV